MMKIPISYLRSLGIRLTSYIDDSLIAGKDAQSCSKNVSLTHNIFKSLGFTINFEKSHIVPSQTIVYLGFIWDTLSMTISLPQDKVIKIISLSQFIVRKNKVSLRKLASLIGLYVSAFPAVLLGKFYYRCLEKAKIEGLRQFNSFEAHILLPEAAREEIFWWINNISLQNGRAIKEPPIFKTIFTDASNSGWGAWCDFNYVSGFWSENDKSFHINFLELKAILLALLTLAEDFENVHLAIKSDNSTAVAYINNMGGIRSVELNNLSKQIWLWCWY